MGWADLSLNSLLDGRSFVRDSLVDSLVVDNLVVDALFGLDSLVVDASEFSRFSSLLLFLFDFLSIFLPDFLIGDFSISLVNLRVFGAIIVGNL